MRLSSGYSPDQYHAFTTRLAAAGHQVATMRVVGGSILALGVPAVLAGVVPNASPWPGFRLVYVVIGLACLGLAAPWFRYRWPTRRESTAVVVLGTLALTGGCLATIDPMAGLLTAVAFGFILGFAALFHSSPLLRFAGISAALTVAVLSVRIAREQGIAAAIAVTTPIVLLCVIITYACRTIATVGGDDRSPADLDPVTGLMTREAFYEQASNLLGARHRDDDRYLVVAAVTVDTLSVIAGVQGSRGTTRALVAAGQALRETVRRGAVIGHLGESDFVVADTFTTADPTPLVERVRGAIASTPSGITASIGVVSAALRPLASRPPQELLDEAIALAGDAMAEARRDGGNQVRYILDKDLRSEDERT